MLEMILSLFVSLILIISKVYYNIFINEFSIIEYIKIISDFSAIVLATLTFFIVYYNLKQIEELKKQREFSKQPILEITALKYELNLNKYLNTKEKSNSLTPFFEDVRSVSISNYGDSPALRVFIFLKIKFDEGKEYISHRSETLIKQNIAIPIYFKSRAINFDFFRFNILLYCNFNFKIELIMLYRNLLGGCYKTVYTYKPKVELNEYQIKDFKNQLEIIQDFIKEAPSLSEQEAYSKWNSIYSKMRVQPIIKSIKPSFTVINYDLFSIKLDEYTQEIRKYADF